MRRWTCLLALAAAVGAASHGQQLFEVSPGSPLRFHPNDTAVLGSDDTRRDLECRLLPQKPRLGFDLKYTAGYVVRVPGRALDAAGDRLRVLFRIQEVDGTADPIHFRQDFHIAAHSADEGSEAAFSGRFFLGPGRYKVDWLMRNQYGLVCSAHWTAHAPQPGHSGRLAATASEGLIAPFDTYTFESEPPVARRHGADGGLHIAVLLNLAPLDRDRFKLSVYETASIIGMLRTLHREPSFGRFSITAFRAVEGQRVLSVKGQTRIDFESLGELVQNTPAGLVEAETLADEDHESKFLAELIREALAGSEEDQPDAVVVLGPKVSREARPDPDSIAPVGDPPALFQFAFHPSPRSYPWQGAIESALRDLGGSVFPIALPRDFSRALEDMLASLQAEPAESPPQPINQ